MRQPDPSFCHDSQQHPQTLQDFRDHQTDFFNKWLMKGPSRCPTFPLRFQHLPFPLQRLFCFASFQDLWCPCSVVSVTASHRLTHSVLLCFLDGSCLRCSVLEVNICCHHLAYMFCRLIPCLSITQIMIPLDAHRRFHITYFMLIPMLSSLGVSIMVLLKCRFIVMCYRKLQCPPTTGHVHGEGGANTWLP